MLNMKFQKKKKKWQTKITTLKLMGSDFKYNTLHLSFY